MTSQMFENVNHKHISRLSMALYTLGLILAYTIGLVVYRLYFSPLSKIPGDKLAAITWWYEFYYDVPQRGQYERKIKEMHKKYGPIVRTNPNEVHIDDPEFNEKLYGFELKLDKPLFFTNGFLSNGSTNTTPHHAVHKMRRGALAPFFTQAKVNQLQPSMVQKIERACSIIEAAKQSAQPVNLDILYKALTVDIITAYAVGESFDFLEDLDKAKSWLADMRELFEGLSVSRHFVTISQAMLLLPTWLATKLVPALRSSLENVEFLDMLVGKVMKDDPKKYADLETPTVFHELLYRSNLPPSELTLNRLSSEGSLIIIAGSETTGNALHILHYLLLTNPSKLESLKAELRAAMPESSHAVPTLKQLKQLPYLNACIEEALRLADTVPHRLTRAVPAQGLEWRGMHLPAGCDVGMSAPDLNRNATNFPQPDSFVPERWLRPAAPSTTATATATTTTTDGASSMLFSPELRRLIMPFSKGPRNCLGMELAYAELLLVTAMVQRRFDTELWDTTPDDVLWKHDFFTAFPADDARGLRVVVK